MTDPAPVLFTPGKAKPSRRRADVVVAISTNDGQISEDLMNRGCPST